MMRRMLWAIALCLLLTGCVPVYGASTLPPYVVMLTELYPATATRCTGAALDPTHVLTAAHCVGHVRRVVTPNGQEATIIDVALAPHDMAIVELDDALWMTQFAQLAQAQPGTLGAIYGTCPYFWGHQPRWAVYQGMQSIEVERNLWVDYDVWISTTYSDSVCGGDSGGVVMQGDKVVGIISAVDSWFFWVAYGQVFFTVPAEIASEIGAK